MVKREGRETAKRSLCAVLCVCVAAAFLLIGTDAFALSGKLGENGRIDVDTTVKYGIGWRLENRSKRPELQTEGDQNFSKYDKINNFFSLGVDADLQWKHVGVFARGRSLYDFEYYGESDMPKKTEERHGKYAELLDLFAYTDNVNLGEFPVMVRVGRQSISWGESMFLGNSISTAQSPLDGTQANAPGVQLKDVFLPTGSAYAQISSPASKVTLAGYYKWEWNESYLDERGAYFSKNDALDKAGESLDVGLPITFPRGTDRNASDGGEYGVTLRYLAESGTEYGLYYLNYHETLPNVKIDPTNTYFLEYQENVDLFGATVVDLIGPVQVGLEINYRTDLEVQVNSSSQYREAEVLQGHLVMIYLHGELRLGNFTLAQSAQGGFEWIYQRVLDLDSSELTKDKWANGGIARFTLQYFNVLNGLDVDVPVTFRINPGGDGAAQAAGLVEDAHGFALGADMTYLGVYKMGITYNAYTGDNSNIRDRDNISLNFSYTF